MGPEGVALVLEGFRYGPLALFGRVEGAWGEVSGSGRVAVFGREARVSGRFGAEGLRLTFFGDLRGEVAWEGAWTGRLAFREGWVALSGQGVPELEGEVLGEAVRLLWPRLQVGGLAGPWGAGGRGPGTAPFPAGPGGVEAWGRGEPPPRLPPSGPRPPLEGRWT